MFILFEKINNFGGKPPKQFKEVVHMTLTELTKRKKELEGELARIKGLIKQQKCKHEYGNWRQYYVKSVSIIEWARTCQICGCEQTTRNAQDLISKD